jgi:hypothetical protein
MQISRNTTPPSHTVTPLRALGATDEERTPVEVTAGPFGAGNPSPWR